MQQKIRSKQEFYELYERGCFGNRLRTFGSIEAYLKNPEYQGPVTMRYRGPAGGVKPQFNVSRDQLEGAATTWVQHGLSRSDIQLNESAPDNELVLQGEVSRDFGWYLRYSQQSGLSMSQAMQNAGDLRGPRVPILLRSVMTPSSWADFSVLTERYPSSVIELGIYARTLGDIPGRNTVIWEVRNY